MDFFERWAGLAPDGGNGAVELAVLMAGACAVLAVFGLVLWRRRLIRVAVRS